LETSFAGQPTLYFVRAVLGFLFFQQLVVSTFSLNDLAVVGILVLLDLTCATRELLDNSRD